MSTVMRPSAAKIIAAFLAVYIVWGSTYLAIAVAIDSIPPFLMAGARFLISGAILLGYSFLRGASWPSIRQWRNAAIVGTLLLMGGNGAVVWSEQHVPTGVVALLVATVPLWMVLLGWLWRGGAQPDWRVWTGLALGLAGVGVLIGPEALGAGRVDLLGAGVVLAGSFAWATGSIVSRNAELPSSPLLATGMEMFAGGLVLSIAGAACGEWHSFDVSRVTPASIGALAYLVFVGSLVGFTAYIWLLKTVAPARAATYAYVNPVVAVVLGWMFRGETLGARTLVSALVVLAAVALITSRTTASAPPSASNTAMSSSSANTRLDRRTEISG